MNNISKNILENFQIRKTKKQKLSFIEYIKRYFPQAVVEEGGGFIKSRNIVVGDVNSAKVIFTAHYDTCARLPFPNLILPKNILLTLLYSVLICVPFFVLGYGAYMLFGMFIDTFFIKYSLAFFAGFLAMVLVMFVGIPNKHTANDNTSGVVTLCELMDKISEKSKSKCAFVFFDNEEIGLLGSAMFRKKYKKILADKVVINFDCVGDGDNFLIVENKIAKKLYHAELKEVFSKVTEKEIRYTASSTTYYPSDQMGFPINMAVVALKGKRPCTFYLDKIHTNADVNCAEKNIKLLSDTFIEFAEIIT